MASIQGKETDTLGEPIRNAVVLAAKNNNDTYTTLTDADGDYMITLLMGTYTITAEAEGYATANIIYTDILVPAGSTLTGYDFVLSE